MTGPELNLRPVSEAGAQLPLERDGEVRMVPGLGHHQQADAVSLVLPFSQQLTIGQSTAHREQEQGGRYHALGVAARSASLEVRFFELLLEARQIGAESRVDDEVPDLVAQHCRPGA